MLPPDRREILALALLCPDLDLVVDLDEVVLTPHAVQRYRERVEGVSRRLAVRRLQHLIATARWRSRPRAWTEVVLHPDVVYGYSPDRPDICLLMRRRAIVTVFSRRFLMHDRVPQQRTTDGGRADRHRNDGRRTTDRRHLSAPPPCPRSA